MTCIKEERKEKIINGDKYVTWVYHYDNDEVETVTIKTKRGQENG